MLSYKLMIGKTGGGIPGRGSAVSRAGRRTGQGTRIYQGRGNHSVGSIRMAEDTRQQDGKMSAEGFESQAQEFIICKVKQGSTESLGQGGTQAGRKTNKIFKNSEIA